MKLSHFDVKDAPVADLKTMIFMCEEELKIRKNAHRDELIKTICDAMNILHKEYPMIELRMDFQCPECALDDDFDVMEYFCGGKQMSPKDFRLD